MRRPILSSASAALVLLALSACAGAQTARSRAAISPATPGGVITGPFGQPITAMGNPYLPFIGAGPLGNNTAGLGPLVGGRAAFGPLSQVTAGQGPLGLVQAGQGPLALMGNAQNLLSNQPRFAGSNNTTPVFPNVNSPLILSPGGPGFGYAPVVGFGGPSYGGYGYYGPQSAYYSGGVPGISGGATVNTALSGGALAGSPPIARTSDWIDARLLGSSRVEVAWQGDPRAVSRVTFVLLDRNRKPIKEQVVTRRPVRAVLNLTNKTAYYQVIVQYVNGTTTSLVSPL